MTEASVPIDGDDRTTDGATSNAPARHATPLWLAVTIAVLFGVLYVYDVWEAVRDLVGMSLLVGDLGVSFAPWGVVILVAALVVPLLVFGIAFWLGRHRGPLAQIVLFAAGYALVQALAFDFAALFELGGIDFS
ncbi:MAG TPA: hypothetical protein VFG92_06735 [Agromyces sp.]|nr:hypothetical protein [Agromyces sp.]